jgi:hypothetical protein
MNSTYEDEFALPLPITQTARDLAQRFAREQPTPEKSEQVRLNTLAVSVVNDYLQLMGITTDLPGSDSWNPVMRLCADVADLRLPEVGRLECRPFQEGESFCPIPPEVWEERVGYVVVQIDDSSETAQLLGYVAEAAIEALPLDRLQPPEMLFDHLYELRSDLATQPASISAPAQIAPRINLTQWLQGIVDSSWQTVDWLLNQPELAPAYAFRSADTLPFRDLETGIRRLKLLHLGRQPGDMAVVLIVDLQPEAEMAEAARPIAIRLQLHPISQPQLPSGVQLIVLDEVGVVFLNAESREQDSYLQLQFSGMPGELFSIQIQFEGIEAIEDVVI